MTARVSRAEIESRAAVMAEAMAVEDVELSELKADPARWLALLHGIRFGAMAAVEIAREDGT